jgi:SAM-dependent methyltransferase
MSKVTQNLPQGVSFDNLESADRDCPNCMSSGLSMFYGVEDIPVHSCLLMSAPEQALQYPRGNLHLGFCSKCGFITDTLFDPSVHDYSAQYEETQGFSACFNAFAKSLAQEQIDAYEIRNKTVLEIGCGKGEFLALMCKLGNNRGIGIDPAYVPQRNPDSGSAHVEYIQDFYGEKYANLEADVICCRHTLEHIGPVGEFVRMLRKTIGGRKDTLVFFEVPDVMRVLREGAFWDIYYEHSSYFTAGSLARLFRSAGFEIDRLYLDYDDQYLIITAYPAGGPTQPSLELENDLAFLEQAIGRFKDNCSGRIDYWLNTVTEAAADGQKPVIWGSSSKGVAFLTTLKLTDEIRYVVDINPYKHGKYMPGTGQEIVAPDFLSKYQPQLVIAMNPIYRDEIRQSLAEMGLSPRLMSV